MERIRDLPPATRMYAVYAAYGKAMMSAHAVERKLAAILLAHYTDTIAPGLTRDTSIQHLDRMTFGQLIKEFVATHGPSDDLAEELDNMLFLRNDLAHRIADTILRATMVREWEEGLITKLMEWDLMFRDASDLLKPFSDRWIQKHDINYDNMLSAVLNLYPGISG